MPEASLIIPFFNAASWLPLVLPPLSELDELWQVILVDDGSTDGSAELATRLLPSARIAKNPERLGAWAARNAGVTQALAPIVVFIDADVLATASTLRSLLHYLQTHPQLTAVFGSYDDQPAAPPALSRFRNLLHHYVHQQAPRQAVTFWAGCGAVRKAAFTEVGGFSACPIEDVELGLRLTAKGHVIHVDGSIQVKHLKEWTWESMIRADILVRGVPWTELMLRYPILRQHLNSSPRHRWPPFLLLLSIGLYRYPLVAMLYLALNFPIYRFMYRQGGLQLAVPSILYLAVHHACCLAGLGIGLWDHLWRRPHW